MRYQVSGIRYQGWVESWTNRKVRSVEAET